MTAHDHEDVTQVAIGCPACIARIRAQEEAAAIEAMPLELPLEADGPDDDQASLFEEPRL